MPEVKIPQIGLTDDFSILTEWKVKIGDYVKKGQCLFIVETNKASYDINSDYDGYVCDIYFKEGDEVQVNKAVCMIGENMESYKPKATSQDKEETKTILQEKEEPKSKSQEDKVLFDEELSIEEPRTNPEKINISPRAKQKAIALKVDYNKAIPTGAENRIIERDIDKLAQEFRNNNYEAKDTGQVQVDNDYSIRGKQEKCTNLRKQIAKNMYNSVHTMAQITIDSSFDATNLLDFKKKATEEGSKLSINGIILYIVSRTISEYPYLNAHYMDDYFELFENVNLGVAVNTDKGLFVPTIFNAHVLSITQISALVRELAEKCRDGKIEAREMSNATFTVTNLGKYGIEHSMPVINPPQIGILGVNTLDYKFKKENNGFVIYPAITLSLTFNHMAIDGVPAAMFLQSLCHALSECKLLENEKGA